ncbi:MAG: LamG domain-containing protein [Phycisphaerae bacterium]|nr:LamG domain-containing protein [Phycisphaerae bacterium]
MQRLTVFTFVLLVLCQTTFGAVDEIFWRNGTDSPNWTDAGNWLDVDAVGSAVEPNAVVPTAAHHVRVIGTYQQGYTGTFDDWFYGVPGVSRPGWYYGVDGFIGSPLTKASYPKALFMRQLHPPVIGEGMEAVCAAMHIGRMNFEMQGGRLTLDNGGGLLGITGISGIGDATFFMRGGEVNTGTLGVGFGGTGRLEVSGGTMTAATLGIGGGWGTGNLIMSGGTLVLKKELKFPWNSQGNGRILVTGGKIVAKALVLGKVTGDGNPNVRIENGVILLEGDHIATINKYFADGWITLPDNDPNLEVALDYDTTNPGMTTLTVIFYKSAQASHPYPINMAPATERRPRLKWQAGAGAELHKIYMGPDEESLELVATQAAGALTYDPGLLFFGQRVFWRVDECDSSGSVLPNGRGVVWNFTVADYERVDDFESYADDPNALKAVWAGAETISTVMPHGGAWSMAMVYDHNEPPLRTEVNRAFSPARDWRSGDIRSMQLFFRGEVSNEPNDVVMYAEITDGRGITGTVAYDGPRSDLSSGAWSEWNIDTAVFAQAGVDLKDVVRIGFGLDDSANPKGGRGRYFFDDVALFPARCLAENLAPGDINGDCLVDLRDLIYVAADWLISDTLIEAVQPLAPRLWYKMDQNMLDTVVNDSSGNGNHGSVPMSGLTPNTWTKPGHAGKCFTLDGSSSIGITVPQKALGEFERGITIAAWINGNSAQPRNDVIFEAKNAAGVRTLEARVPFGDGMIGFITSDGTSTNWLAYEPASDGEYKLQWNHYAFVKDVVGQVQQIYRNGTLHAELPFAAAPIAIDKFEIGRRVDATQMYLGSLDDFRIYDYALSQAEIIDAMGQASIYTPLDSKANLIDLDPDGRKAVNLADFAVIAADWMTDLRWP